MLSPNFVVTSLDLLLFTYIVIMKFWRKCEATEAGLFPKNFWLMKLESVYTFSHGSWSFTLSAPPLININFPRTVWSTILNAFWALVWLFVEFEFTFAATAVWNTYPVFIAYRNFWQPLLSLSVIVCTERSDNIMALVL